MLLPDPISQVFDEDAHWGETLSDQEAFKSSRRDGSFGSGLQPDAGHDIVGTKPLIDASTA
jgi:hypothetical protein